MHDTTRSSRLRLLILGRRFWPHGGHDSACHLINLACGLHRQGIHVEVATPRFATSWPEEFRFREFTVHRPLPAPKSDWSVSRYTRQLTQWLRAKVPSFDVVMVDSIREEAVAAIEATRGSQCRTLVRLGSQDAVSDVVWWQRSRAGRRCAVIGRMADRIIVKNADQAKSLLTHQYDPAKIKRIEVGFGSPSNRVERMQSDQSRRETRRSLASVNSDLLTDDDTIVLLCQSRMVAGGRIFSLVQAARLLITKHPNLRVWFVGDGPARDKIYSTLRGDGIRAHIAMPGSFCSRDDLMAVADVYVQCGPDGSDHFLQSAVGYGLPIVADDVEENRSVFAETPNSPAPEVFWFDGSKEYDLRKKINQLLNDRTNSLLAAADLKRRMLQIRPESRMWNAYLDSLHELAGDPASDPANVQQSTNSTIANQSTMAGRNFRVSG